MREQEIRLEKLTRREFRAALAAEHYQVAILPTGSIEQHLEHLALEQDIVSSTYVAEQVAGTALSQRDRRSAHGDRYCRAPHGVCRHPLSPPR